MKKLMTMIGSMMLTASLFAANDPTFGYQGVLRDERGNQLSGVDKVTIEFRLYNGTEDTEAKWGRRMPVQIDTNGLFNAELADANGSPLVSSKLSDVLHESEVNGKPIYVGLTVDGSSGEIRPRQKLITVPIAAYAQDVSVAKGELTVNGQATFKNGVGIEEGKLTAPAIDISGDAALVNVLVDKGIVVKQNATVGGNIAATGTVSAAGFYFNNGDCATTPVGAIIMWSGSSSHLPPGWRMCDGQSQYVDPYSRGKLTVPDLRGRFVIGVNSRVEGYSFADGLPECNLKAVGGSESVVLEEEHIASHTHNYIADDTIRRSVNGLLDTAKILDKTGGGTEYIVAPSTPKDAKGPYLKWDLHDDESGKWDEQSINNNGSQRATLAYTGKNNLNGNTSKAAAAHDNMPPYYALCFIIYLGSSEVTTNK